MTGLRWLAAVPVLAGALTGSVAVAAASEPAPAPPTPAEAPTSPTAAPTSPDPAASPTPTPTETPTPPIPPGTETVVYLTTVTTTTTTTNVNAPITVVTAPITTTLTTPTTPTTPTQPAGAAPDRLVMYLNGCGRPAGPSPSPQRDRVRNAHVRLGSNATLVVRVNGRHVATLHIPSTARRRQMMRLRLAPNGMLTIRRPSGRVLAVQGCTPA